MMFSMQTTRELSDLTRRLDGDGRFDQFLSFQAGSQLNERGVRANASYNQQSVLGCRCTQPTRKTRALPLLSVIMAVTVSPSRYADLTKVKVAIRKPSLLMSYETAVGIGCRLSARSSMCVTRSSRGKAHLSARS